MRILGWFMAVMTSFGVIGGVAGLGAVLHFSQDLPSIDELADYEPSVVTRLHANDGRIMAEYAIENRVFMPINAIPPLVQQAFISAEDRNFRSHDGVDWLSIGRAMLVTNPSRILEGRRMVGASTITQQVAKNFLLSNEYSLTRKIEEALLALRMERALEKDEILELYLNEIYLGRGAYGVASASLAYFNRPLHELTLAEIAYLAGLPQAPNNYNPVTQTERALARRSYVLNRMLEDGVITKTQAEEADAAPLEVADRRRTTLVEAGYFAEEVRRELQRLYGDRELYRGGLSVQTTMDPELQEIAERALRGGLIEYDRQHGYRGPIQVWDDFDDWPARLAALDQPSIGGWQPALVLDVAEDGSQAIIGFADRRRGVIQREGVEWAGEWRPGQRGAGPAPRRVSDVLELGHVIMVERVGGPASGASAVLEGDEGEVAPPSLYALRQIPEVQGALVAIDPESGEVLAMVGGFDFALSEFNRATQAARQPGSAFKPFVYLAALNEGYTPSTIVLDAPIAIRIEGQADYRPSNFGNDQLGAVPMRVGLERSRNLMTVRLLQEIGMEPVQNVARLFGIYENMPPLYSMALGAGEVTPLQLTNAFAMIANGGRLIEPTFISRIQDRNGRTIYDPDPRHCELCVNVAWQGQQAPALGDPRPLINDPVAVLQVREMLEGVVQRGTAARMARLNLPLAGKTGTSQDFRDAWFVGFSPNLAVGVFVGFDQPRTLGPSATGSGLAVPIFETFMVEALEGVDPGQYPQPAGVVRIAVDSSTGMLPDGSGASLMQSFRRGTEPSQTAEAAAGPQTQFGDTLNRSLQGTGGLY